MIDKLVYLSADICINKLTVLQILEIFLYEYLTFSLIVDSSAPALEIVILISSTFFFINCGFITDSTEVFMDGSIYIS